MTFAHPDHISTEATHRLRSALMTHAKDLPSEERADLFHTYDVLMLHWLKSRDFDMTVAVDFAEDLEHYRAVLRDGKIDPTVDDLTEPLPDGI